MAPRGDGDGFLTRWSRRKLEGQEPPLRPHPEEPQSGVSKGAPDVSGASWTILRDADPVGSAPQDEGSRGIGSSHESAASAEPEMIEPPSLDLIDKDFDVAHWLKQNVPESWKLAALRRAWESDPFIAGFENPARDYALEWNIPGGAPGYGPLTESDDVAAMVRNIFGDTPKPEPADPTVAEATGDSMPHQNVNYDESRIGDAAAQQDGAGGPEPESVRLTDNTADEPKSGEKTAIAVDGVYAAAQNSAPSDPPAVRIRKRGGGAMPV
jgi:hypothetical protein